MVAPAWQAAEYWRTPDVKSLASLADGIADAQAHVRDLVPGLPAGGATDAGTADHPWSRRPR
jgi:hypothetical protein